MSRVRTPGDGPKCWCGAQAVYCGYCAAHCGQLGDWTRHPPIDRPPAREISEDSSLPPRAPEGRREVSTASSGGIAGDSGAALARLFKCGPTGSAEDYDTVFGALERARVVGIIDAWAEANPKHHVPVATPYHSEGGRGPVLWRISVGDYRAQSFPSADAVRFAAVEHIESTAKAISEGAV